MADETKSLSTRIARGMNFSAGEMFGGHYFNKGDRVVYDTGSSRYEGVVVNSGDVTVGVLLDGKDNALWVNADLLQPA